MKELQWLNDRLCSQLNINLREYNFDAGIHVRHFVPIEQLFKFYAFYGVTANHPLHLHFSHSNIAGSYFLGKIEVDNSILYKSDIRGDELKKKGAVFNYNGTEITMTNDELIKIQNSFLIKTLVHNFTHDPEDLSLFLIKNTISMPYANIHGSSINGCFLNPFSTVDLTTLHDCIIGNYSYVQVEQLAHKRIKPGLIWIKGGDSFNFKYEYDLNDLKKYVSYELGGDLMGMCINYAENLKDEFQKIFNVVHLEKPRIETPGAHISRYAVFKGESKIEKNVLIAQRAYIENSFLGQGANAQENCYISHSELEGYNVTAHGATIINANLGRETFVGFNCFLIGKSDALLKFGEECIVMPHTIIDITEPLSVPPGHLVWGLIKNNKELEENSISLSELSKFTGKLKRGNMLFNGLGYKFVEAFQHRIHHILEENGAFYNGKKSTEGHSQKSYGISFNIIQPYQNGPLKGLFPTIDINP